MKSRISFFTLIFILHLLLHVVFSFKLLNGADCGNKNSGGEKIGANSNFDEDSLTKFNINREEYFKSAKEPNDKSFFQVLSPENWKTFSFSGKSMGETNQDKENDKNKNNPNPYGRYNNGAALGFNTLPWFANAAKNG